MSERALYTVSFLIGLLLQEILLFNTLSASRTRRSRACCRVESDSFIRETASLSGVMLKLPIVWCISWKLLALRSCPACVSYGRGIFVEKHRGKIYALVLFRFGGAME